MSADSAEKIRGVERSVREHRVVAIVRGYFGDTCLRLAEALAEGGIRLLEVTFMQKSPESWRDTAGAIAAVRERFGDAVLAGAGTVLTEEQLSLCEEAGGAYAIMPNVNTKIIGECVRRGVAAMPGALTPSEIVTAWEAGASFVKIFPAGNLGPGYIKAIRAPLAHIPLLAVGGVGPDNVADYLSAGCVGAGIGGSLTNREWIEAGEWDKITDAARRVVEKCVSFK